MSPGTTIERIRAAGTVTIGVKYDAPPFGFSERGAPPRGFDIADLILSTMTITAERDEEIDFSEPYYVARGRILVREGSDIRRVGDLAGRRVCTALGSTYEQNAGMRDGDATLQRFVSEVIAAWKADGGWERAYARWIGRFTGEERDPPAIDLREALALNP